MADFQKVRRVSDDKLAYSAVTIEGKACFRTKLEPMKREGGRRDDKLVVRERSDVVS